MSFWSTVKRVASAFNEILQEEKNQKILIEELFGKGEYERYQRSRQREEIWVLRCNCGRYVDHNKVIDKIGDFFELHERYAVGSKGYVGLCKECKPESGFDVVEMKNE